MLRKKGLTVSSYKNRKSIILNGKNNVPLCHAFWGIEVYNSGSRICIDNPKELAKYLSAHGDRSWHTMNICELGKTWVTARPVNCPAAEKPNVFYLKAQNSLILLRPTNVFTFSTRFYTFVSLFYTFFTLFYTFLHFFTLFLHISFTFFSLFYTFFTFFLHFFT